MPSIRQNPYPDALPDFRNLGVALEGLAERLPVSRRQWQAVKGVLPEA